LIKPEPKKRQVLSLLTNKVPFDEIQIDSQVMDLHCSCNFEINGELLPLRLSRLSIYYAIDVATDCILSYKICFTQHPNQQDVTDLIIGIIKPWKPMHLKIPGLKYSPEACLPSNLGVEFRAIAINMIRMDNALCHMAHSIRDLICHKLNATLNFGLPKRPKGRNYIEHAIAIISKDLHRFESTTGSNPNSHIKEKGGSNKKIPVITLDALEEVLSVLITDHNIKSQAKLNRSSPLQVLKQYVSQNYMNLNPTQIHIANSLHLKQKVVPVKWIKSENRRPHINFENLRYTGNCLSAKELQNKEVIVEYDESDIRTLKVLSLDGKPIGTVVAPRTWQSKRHSVRTRSRIFKIVKHERSLSADPLSGYFNYIYEKRHLPKYATELARIFREFSSQTFHTEDISSASNDDTSSDSTQLGSKRRKHKIPTWTPEIELLPVRRG
ncbi:MAG: Mu transposase C-terminal domain-containing protein, partial [Gammaproteobacteria bacterium]|nr:Mu transposase C-terminal domain-containing protein [Gammaproteobacteria bacterium]